MSVKSSPADLETVVTWTFVPFGNLAFRGSTTTPSLTVPLKLTWKRYCKFSGKCKFVPAAAGFSRQTQSVKKLSDHHVVEILHESKSQKPRTDRAQRLVKEAVEKSGRNNNTALVIEIA